MYTCEKCGKEVTTKYGSGRFCSRYCANSRNFSEASKQKKRAAVVDTEAYSNGKEARYFRPTDVIPEGFVRGNFSNARNYKTFEEFVLGKELEKLKTIEKTKVFREKHSKEYYIARCRSYIDAHNKQILEEYEALLKSKAVNKVFEIKDSFMFAKYLSVTQHDHPRQHQGHIFVHILLAECLLERFLGPKEIVHHKDSDKLHNTFDNIYIFDNKASHARFHHSDCYWLTIEKDVLVCSALSKEKLKTIAFELE